MSQTILVVEDEKKIRDIIHDYFVAAGFLVIEAEDGQKGLELFYEQHPDLIILDIMLPKMDGWSVCKRIRKESDVPVIMLTARAEEEDKLMGFELKADEYVTKPFSPAVLVARAKILLQRATGTLLNESQRIEAGGIVVEKDYRTVTVEGKDIELTPKEYDLLIFFMENAGIVLSREKILNNVWDYSFFGNGRVVDTHVKKLRKLLGEKAYLIRTSFGVGYKFDV
jgi:DNA-binding response OmpR family regulator